MSWDFAPHLKRFSSLHYETWEFQSLPISVVSLPYDRILVQLEYKFLVLALVRVLIQLKYLYLYWYLWVKYLYLYWYFWVKYLYLYPQYCSSMALIQCATMTLHATTWHFGISIDMNWTNSTILHCRHSACLPASSATVECVFSRRGLTMKPLKSKLSCGRVSALG